MNHFFNGLRASSKIITALLLFYNIGLSSPLNTWLECPPNVTINCEESTADLDKWGKIWVWEDYVKKPGPVPKEIIYNLNSCGIGEIIRSWEYTDKHAHVLNCKQTITIINSGTLFNDKDIIWPLNIELEGCNPAYDPKDLPKTFNYPSFYKRTCSQPMYSFQDSKFTIADGCVKVLRTWKVIDWCQYIPNSKNTIGLWTYTQVIKLIAKDSLARLICPKDTIINSYSDCKGLFVNLDSVTGFSKCGKITNISNNSPYSKSKGANASGYYPIGKTKFYFIGEYSCGKQITCEITITVVNKVSPTAYCLPGIIVALMPVDSNRDGTPEDGMIQVWAKDVDHGSYSNCGKNLLFYSFSKDIKNTSRIFTCAELGKNEVELWITDTLGNYSFCKTMIEIQNNNANIPDCKRDSIQGGNKKFLNIAGTITNIENEAVHNITLNLTDLNSFTISQKIDTQINIRYDTIKRPSGTIFYVTIRDTVYKVTKDTLKASITSYTSNDTDGKYSFKNLISPKEYKVAAKCSMDDLKGIDTDDAIILLRHLLGVTKIRSTLNQIAADINGDGYISNIDFDLLYGVINGTKDISNFKRRWCFIPKSNIPHTLNQVKEEINYQPLLQSVTNADFYAIKIGDLNSSFQKNYNTIISNRTTEEKLYAICNQSNFYSGNTYTIELKLNKIQYGLLLNNIPEFIENLEFDEAWRYEPTSKYLICLANFGSDRLKLKFRCIKDFSITNNLFQNFFLSSTHQSIQIMPYENNTSNFAILEANPNPIHDNAEFRLSIYCSQMEDFTFKLFDAQGHFIESKKNQLFKGFNQWPIQFESAQLNGMYYYQIANRNQVYCGKLIISK